ncbi:IS5 family transposase [Planctomicrobium sp. SH661]|uniref:IS5 family transposase n=1 Tax=Planctomicrobium sp. SH661 TaxID=3448124 RepID=UPI003F5BE01D
MSRHRHELTDAQWEKIKDLLPGKPGDPGRTGVDNRLFVDAVVFVLKTGIPWADLPERFGNWNSIWRRFDRWSAKGVWEKLSKALSDPDLTELHLDSSSIKAHPVASTGRRQRNEKKKMPTPEDAWGEVGED